MGFDFTTANLIADIKRRTFLPINQITYTDEDLLEYADEEIQVGIVPLLMSVREDYLVTFAEEEVTANQLTYSVPERAIGMKLKDVSIIQNTSDPLNPIETQLPRIQSDQGPTNIINNFPGYFLRANKIVLQNPNVFDGQTIRKYYFLRPNKLVLTNQAAQITEVGPKGSIPVLNANQVLVNNIPSNFGSEVNFDVTIDFVKNKPGFETITLDVEATCNSSQLIITFPDLTSLPTDLEAGDWVCLQGETPIPQLPVELHPLLAQRVAVKILEGQGDAQNLAAAQSKLKEAEKAVLSLLSNRVESAPQKIVNPFSTLRLGPWRRY